MSVPGDSNGRASSPEETAGLLSNLPRTRPQRSTARRSAARNAAAAKDTHKAAATAASGSPTAPKRKPAKRTTAKPTAQSKPAAKPRASVKAKARKAPKRVSAPPPLTEAVPLQGFESEGDRLHGAVHPPSGSELVASATEILGEFAKIGAAAGERLLRDVFSRLPRP